MVILNDNGAHKVGFYYDDRYLQGTQAFRMIKFIYVRNDIGKKIYIIHVLLK